MKFIIYFGHHKVGSTALQSYLARNALALLQQGILYPAVESEGMSHLLAQALGRKSNPALDCMNVREPHNALGFRMLASKKPDGKTPPWHGQLPELAAMLLTLRHQVEILQPETVVLCSEVFANFGAGHADLIATLRTLFPDAEQELYCALRRPDEYMASWYGQLLRFGRKLDPLSEGSAIKPKSIHFNYRKMVEPWVQSFDGARLHLRNYADILKAGGSVQDFITQVSAPFPNRLPEQGPVNKGLPRASYEIIRRANHDLPDKDAQDLREVFLQLPPHKIPVKNGDVELFGAQRRAQLTEEFAPIHAYLSQLTNQPAFFPDIDEMNRTRPLSDQEAARRLLVSLDPAGMESSVLSDYISKLQQTL